MIYLIQIKDKEDNDMKVYSGSNCDRYIVLHTSKEEIKTLAMEKYIAEANRVANNIHVAGCDN